MKLAFFPEIGITTGSVESNGILSDNQGHNILELYNVLIRTQWTTSKTERGS